MALLDLSMQEKSHTWTHVSEAEDLIKGAIDLRLSTDRSKGG